MTKHKTGTREEWLHARLDLLKAEKELTRRSDELAQQRQELPWVKIDKEYQFETDDGKASLKDLFRGRSQLLVYHFMLGPDYTAGCPSCSVIADGYNGIVVHLPHPVLADPFEGHNTCERHPSLPGRVRQRIVSIPPQPRFPYSSCRFHHWYGAVWG